MKIICIDDEYLILQRNVSMLKKIQHVSQVEGFLSSEEALEYLESHPVDMVFLDINMPGMGGLELAALMREKWPEMIIVFLTAYSEYAVDAFRIRANGYLVKPVLQEQFEAEIRNAAQILGRKLETPVKVRTFGNFDLFIGDSVVSFSRSISKEILAYLVCKKGTGVTRPEIASILWEDSLYDRSRQKQLDVYIRSLSQTLKEYEIERILEKHNGTLRVRTEYLDCDYYQYLKGDISAKKQYFGEFMNNYSWAEFLKRPFIE